MLNSIIRLFSISVESSSCGVSSGVVSVLSSDASEFESSESVSLSVGGIAMCVYRSISVSLVLTLVSLAHESLRSIMGGSSSSKLGSRVSSILCSSSSVGSGGGTDFIIKRF